MNSTPGDPQPETLIAFARALGRSRSGQFFVAIVMALLSVGTAWLIWHYRTFAALYVVYAVVIYGARKTWEFLPIASGVRRACKMHKDLFIVLWFAGITLADHYWPTGSWQGWRDLLICLLGIIFAGPICYLSQVVAAAHSRKPSGQEPAQSGA